MLRAQFADSLFDLAAIESRIDDTEEGHLPARTERTTSCSVATYTDDGGHLNSAGRQVVAIELLRSLV